MYNGRRVAVIIAAAGRGTRLGTAVPKQYLKIGGEPVIIKAMKVFDRMDEVDYIFVVASEEYLDFCSGLISQYSFNKVEKVIAGGETRQDSVYNALQQMNRRRPGVEYVLIHDAARPFVSEDVVRNVLHATATSGAAVACVAMKNSVRRLSPDMEQSESVDRSEYYSVQTPQGFRKSLLIEAYEKAYDESFFGTDDAAIVENAGGHITIVDGEYQNIKITTKEDLPMENRVGTGYDVHRLVEGRKLILGGVDIPFDRGLEGHSDADVLIHAIMDALLGAAGLGDIGLYFPDTDPEYEGISSIRLLQKVHGMLEEAYYQIGNIDATLICQRPKITPHTERMRQNLADALDIDVSRINIKATTTERLGFTGREEGIACDAICSIYR